MKVTTITVATIILYVRISFTEKFINSISIKFLVFFFYLMCVYKQHYSQFHKCTKHLLTLWRMKQVDNMSYLSCTFKFVPTSVHLFRKTFQGNSFDMKGNLYLQNRNYHHAQVSGERKKRKHTCSKALLKMMSVRGKRQTKDPTHFTLNCLQLFNSVHFQNTLLLMAVNKITRILTRRDFQDLSAAKHNVLRYDIVINELLVTYQPISINNQLIIQY